MKRRLTIRSVALSAASSSRLLRAANWMQPQAVFNYSTVTPKERSPEERPPGMINLQSPNGSPEAGTGFSFGLEVFSATTADQTIESVSLGQDFWPTLFGVDGGEIGTWVISRNVAITVRAAGYTTPEVSGK